MGWLRKTIKKIGRGIKKIGKKIGKAFKSVLKPFAKDSIDGIFRDPSG